jgi:hypothetical protein
MEEVKGIGKAGWLRVTLHNLYTSRILGDKRAKHTRQSLSSPLSLLDPNIENRGRNTIWENYPDGNSC